MSLNNASSHCCLEVLSKTKKSVSQICCRVEATGGRSGYETRILVTDSLAAMFNVRCYRKQKQPSPKNMVIINVREAVTLYSCTLTYDIYLAKSLLEKLTDRRLSERRHVIWYCFIKKFNVDMQSESLSISSQKVLVKHSPKLSLLGLDKGINIPGTSVTTVPINTAAHLRRLESLAALLW
jgi:hypothetical protein